MTIEILMPALSPTMNKGNIAKWLKKEGDKIKPGDVIAEIETDKATMEYESVDDGVLGKILFKEGSKDVEVNSVIAILLEKGEDISALKDQKVNNLNKVLDEDRESNTTKDLDRKTSDNVAHSEAQETKANIRIFASPLAKSIASQKNIDLSKIKGTGPSGRIVKNDLLNITHSISDNKTKRIDQDKIVPNSNVRQIIADRLLAAKQSIPHFYLSIECEVDELLKTREAINSNRDETHPKISVNDLIVMASARSLKDVPETNSSWNETEIIYYSNIDISIAVAIEGGLITPIVKNADTKNIYDLSSAIKILAKKARDNKLAPEEFQGGGFTISNLGMYGIKQFNAIINPPQSAILAVGAAFQQAVFRDGQCVPANIINFTLSCDHRVVDGIIGAKFLNTFRKYIETPILMLI
ncbi:MAG: pyruvate dehydrogenase complex dihydrolipoamide acetyltransferase [Rickettsiaceae bacterium]